MGSVRGTNFHQGHDPHPRSSKRPVHDIENRTTVQSKNNLSGSRCTECEANASGSGHPQLEGCHADTLSGDLASNIEGKWTETAIHAIVKS